VIESNQLIRSMGEEPIVEDASIISSSKIGHCRFNRDEGEIVFPIKICLDIIKIVSMAIRPNAVSKTFIS